jgi:hypothetical protein
MERYTNNVPLVFKRGKSMDNSKPGSFWGILCGISGGMGKYFLQVNLTFPEKLLQAAFAALVCGLFGAFGKWLFDFGKAKFTKNKNINSHE